MVNTENFIYEDAVEQYLNSIKNVNTIPAPRETETKILAYMEKQIELENAVRNQGNKIRHSQTLRPSQIAKLLLALYPIKNVKCTKDGDGPDEYQLALYLSEGKYKGTFSSDENNILALAQQYCFSLTERDGHEIIARLKRDAPVVERCDDPDLVPVGNGIFNYKTKELLPFSEAMVFLTKSLVDYNPNATLPKIPNPDGTFWDVESWIKEIAGDDPEVTQLLWQISAAILRQNVRFNKTILLYSEKGNNGKGTFCVLLRGLCGSGNCISIPIDQMGQRFALQPLIGKLAVITDENPVGTFVDDSSNYKLLATNDPVRIDIKNKPPVTYQFNGLTVECFNEYPRAKDRTSSFYRRLLFVPFTKCFTGAENKLIKDDYLKRPDVLEYVLMKALNTDFDEFIEPTASTAMLADYKEFNDPVREFLAEVLPEASWTLLPYTFLYALFRSWSQMNNPNGKVVGRNSFIREVKSLVDIWGDEWVCPEDSVRSKGRMDFPEPLIFEYSLGDWMNPDYHGDVLEKRCSPPVKEMYRGLLRKSVADADEVDGND